MGGIAGIRADKGASNVEGIVLISNRGEEMDKGDHMEALLVEA